METNKISDSKGNIRFLEGNIQYLPLLLYLSQKLNLNKTDILSTVEIANDMQFSQQTASRKMLELEELGFIKRKYSPSGLMIGLTEKTIDLLKANYAHLKNIFDNNKEQDKKSIHAVITSGIGEGKFYVQLEKYNQEFTKLLGKKPFPGTLNLVVDKNDYKELLLRKEQVKVEGFQTKERTFGCINCYKVNVKKGKNKVEAFIIIPERTSHPENIAEVIAPSYLRDELKLDDNDKVEIL